MHQDLVPQPETVVAYTINPTLPPPIVPAPATRQWMDDSAQHFAYRCLPMVIANQAGWLLLNTKSFWVTWDGDNEIDSLVIEYVDCGDAPELAISHFGHGILTFHIPYLFRTSKGFNLLARGPANAPKDGIYALEGVIETDWSTSTFTMNWKMTRPGTVMFEQGEAICMIVPQRRGELEAFSTQILPLDTNPELQFEHEQWSQGRNKFLKDLDKPDSEAVKMGWQKDYFKGKTREGTIKQEHQRRLQLNSFSDDPTDEVPFSVLEDDE
jgi:hypothetical protein